MVSASGLQLVTGTSASREGGSRRILLSQPPPFTRVDVIPGARTSTVAQAFRRVCPCLWFVHGLTFLLICSLRGIELCVDV
jgi:hypothetical protein